MNVVKHSSCRPNSIWGEMQNRGQAGIQPTKPDVVYNLNVILNELSTQIPFGYENRPRHFQIYEIRACVTRESPNVVGRDSLGRLR